MKNLIYKPLRTFLTLLLTLSLLLLSVPQMALAAGGAYSINFAAADPADDGFTYPKLTPADLPPIASGRAADPLPRARFGVPNDSVESLMPKDLLLGMVVPFLFKIEVNGSTAPENGVIEFTAYWLTKTTNGGNFGFDPDFMVYSAFVDTADAATVDPGGDATVARIDDQVINAGTANEQIEGTFRIEGLDDGDTAVVEVWLVLKDSTNPKVSGNVQTGLRSAVTVGGSPEVISTGTQTVPLLQSGSFYTAKANLSVTKVDAPDPVQAGGSVTYTITVTNNPPGGSDEHAVANGVMVTDVLDAISTFVSASVSQGSFSRSGQTITWDAGGLAQNESASMTVTVTAPATFTNYDTSTSAEAGGPGSASKGSGPPPRDMVNNVSAAMITADTNPADNTYFQPTNILYKASGSVILTAAKVLAGRTLAAGEFSFQLKLGTAVLQTKTNAANGSVTFDAISYTEADIGKTFNYTIVEVQGSLAGVTYDPMAISVEVLVTDNGNGTLNAAPSYSSDTIFNNTYAAAGSVVLAASKVLTGRALAAGEFSFELREGDTLLQTRTNAANGAITFDAIGYTLASVGLHTYTIREVAGSLGGVTYDPMVMTVTVNVADNGNGTLTATPAYPADKIFNNVYIASGSAVLAVSKILAGRVLAADEFSFELWEGESLLQTKTNAADGAISFDAIGYTLASVGLHTYTIKEVAGSLGGVTYDPMIMTVTVSVADNGNGTLTATPAYPADTAFNNVYAASGSIVLAASKVLAGRTLAADEFSFELWEGESLLQTKKNAADGSVTFDAIGYALTDVGEHTYTIKEVAGSLGGVTYDPMIMTVTVSVADNGNGTLTATPAYPEDTVFNNVYAASGSVLLAASKSLAGRALAADEFSFELWEGESLLQTKKNAANGAISFDAISYALADVGEHTYTIKEIPGSEANMHYDPLAVTVKVMVIDNGDGTLSVTPAYPQDTAFNNEFLTPAITIAKTVANQTAGDPYGELASLIDGEIASYRIIVTNTGNTVLENVTVKDDKVAAGTVATLSTGGTKVFAAVGDGLPEINLGTFQPGDSVTLTYTYETRFSDTARSPITNTATVTGTLPPTRAFPDGQTLTAADDAVINVDAIALADIGLDIIKMVRNKTVNGILAELATGYAGDVFEFEVTVTNPSLQAPLSEVKLYDNRALVGSKVTRVNDNTELTWADDGTGHAMLNIGSLGTQSSLTFRYTYTAKESDEETVIGNIALVKGIYKPEREGYADMPLEADDDAAIGILAPPPTTGETNARGPLAGIGLLLAAMTILMLRRRLRRPTQ